MVRTSSIPLNERRRRERGRPSVAILVAIAAINHAIAASADDLATLPAFQPVFAGGSELYEGARTPPLPEYRVRVDDNLQFLFRLVKESPDKPYRLTAGDTIRISSATLPALNRTIQIEPDGMLTAPRIGRVRAAGETVESLREALVELARATIQEPELQIMAVKLFSPLDEFQSSISGLQTHGELAYFARVSPDGTVQVPAIETVPAAGLTLGELQREAEARFAQVLEGVHVTVLLQARAASRVTVLGEVVRSGRYGMDRPVSVSNAISLAGGWINGADLKHIIVLRRDEQWRLIATCLDLKDDLQGLSIEKKNEIWLRDGDIVLVPKTSLKRFDDAVQLVFTNGLYKFFPFSPSVQAIDIRGGQQFAPALPNQQSDN
jgi:polysaccharide export outer membrane protein